MAKSTSETELERDDGPCKDAALRLIDHDSRDRRTRMESGNRDWSLSGKLTPIEPTDVRTLSSTGSGTQRQRSAAKSRYLH